MFLPLITVVFIRCLLVAPVLVLLLPDALTQALGEVRNFVVLHLGSIMLFPGVLLPDSANQV